MNEIAQKHKTANALLENIQTNTEDYSSNHLLMNFTSNHDENSWGGTVFERLGQSVKTFAALTYFLPGMPLIYSGQEYGLNKRLAFFEKDFIEKDQTDFVSFYSQLAILKKTYSQLHFKKDVRFSILNSSSPNTVVFERSRNKKPLYFIANLSEEEQQIEIPITGSFTSLMDNTNLTLQGTIKLAPWEYHFLNPLNE